MGFNHLLGLLALIVCCHSVAAASSEQPFVMKLNKLDMSKVAPLPRILSTEPAPTQQQLQSVVSNIQALDILQPVNLTRGDVVALLKLPFLEYAAPYVFSGDDLSLKGLLLFEKPQLCKNVDITILGQVVPALKPYNLVPNALALSRSNNLMYACNAAPLVTGSLWSQTDLSSNSTAGESVVVRVGPIENVAQTMSFTYASDETTWALANALYENKPTSFLVNFNSSMQWYNNVPGLNSLAIVRPTQHAMGLNGNNGFFELVNGKDGKVQSLTTEDDVWAYGFPIADIPKSQCTAVLPMPDDTTIIGCAGQGNSTDRICVYHVKGGKALRPNKNKLLNSWCVPAKAAERPLPAQNADMSAEIYLSLSPDRQSLYVAYNDYYQYVLDVAPTFPKFFKISLDAFEQVVNGTIRFHAVGAMAVIDAIPVSQVGMLAHWVSGCQRLCAVGNCAMAYRTVHALCGCCCAQVGVCADPCMHHQHMSCMIILLAGQQRTSQSLLCVLTTIACICCFCHLCLPLLLHSQQDCGTGSCCTPEGKFQPSTFKCRTSTDPCNLDAKCTGKSESCPNNYAEDFTPCSREHHGLFTAVSGFSGMSTASVGGISPAEAQAKQYKKCNLCHKGRCLPTTVIRKVPKGEDKEDWVYCK